MGKGAFFEKENNFVFLRFYGGYGRFDFKDRENFNGRNIAKRRGNPKQKNF